MASQPSPPLLSAVIITRNESAMIEDCLSSLHFVDEILVLDSGSSDDTVSKCRKFTSAVMETDWPGFGVQRNRGHSLAKGHWILSIDADERVSPELADEIRQAIQKTDCVAYQIPFHSHFLGQRMRYGDWRGESHLRLYLKERATFSERQVHEKLQVDGKIGFLKNPIIHYSYNHLEQVLQKINLYSTTGAQELGKRGRRVGLFPAIRSGLWCFFRGYFLRLGFLDGQKGLILAISNAEGVYYRYLKAGYLK